MIFFSSENGVSQVIQNFFWIFGKKYHKSFGETVSHPHPINTPHARTSHAQFQEGFAPLSHLIYRTRTCDRTFARTHTNILQFEHLNGLFPS